MAGSGETNPFLQSALDLAAQGYRVFPLIPGTKRPAIEKWQERATTDPEILKKAWGDRNYNIGVCCGQGLLVIDVDVKDGKPGKESYAALGLDPETYTVATPSGGFHVYLDGPDVANSASRVAPGIDVRSAGGFVVGVGSEISGARYVSLHPGPVKHAPPGLLAACGTPVERANGHVAAPAADLDSEAAAVRGRDYLRAAPPYGSYAVACKLKDFGLSETTALQLMLHHWNDRRPKPHTIDTLTDKVAHAFRYGQNAPGSDHPAAVFGDVEIAPPPPVQASTLKAYRHNDPYDLKSIRWLFPGCFPDRGTAVLVGPSGSGKTFLMIEAARCLATGKSFFGAEPDERGGTVFVFGGSEGSGFELRVKALEESSTLPITGVQVGNLSERNALSHLLTFLREEDERMRLLFGVPLRMVVLETLSASGLLLKEDDNGQAAQAMATLAQLGQALDVLVITTHHPPKGSTGPRGASAIQANTDNVIEIYRDGREKVRRVEAVKIRNGEARSLGSYSLVPVDLGLDYKGRRVQSMVVSLGDSIRVGGRLPPNFERFAQALDFTETEQGDEIDGVQVIPFKAVRDCFASLVPDVSRTTAWRYWGLCLQYAKDLGSVEERSIQRSHYLIRREINDD